ncbi:PABS domain-containing protein [Trichostrongylus colubriformis]|uniref:PABS domain-containing protein n=1 Tax=Trichostrongylus colubriformis TaxID=6319 RepID=A0AAN8FDC2_TRICO
MVAATFLMYSLSLHAMDKEKQVLEIGLGGGSFDMGLHLLKPYVNITAIENESTVVKTAFKWFGVVDSETHHTVLEDGVNFLENALLKGKKYDVVAIDACGPQSSTIVCPVEAFLTSTVLETIRNVLTDTGSLVLNLVGDPTMLDKPGKNEIFEPFESVFPACVLMHFTDLENVVVICVPFSLSHIHDLEQRLNARLSLVISRLNLGYVLDGSYITRLYEK